jgi:hypothetical protein
MANYSQASASTALTRQRIAISSNGHKRFILTAKIPFKINDLIYMPIFWATRGERSLCADSAAPARSCRQAYPQIVWKEKAHLARHLDSLGFSAVRHGR